MRNERIYIERAKRFVERLKEKQFSEKVKFECSYIYDERIPIPYERALQSLFKPIKQGEVWGETWGCGWFKLKGIVPKKMQDKEIAALIDLNGEACVYIDGVPDQGLTNKIHWDHRSGKYFYPLTKCAKAGEEIELLLETGANGLFGEGQKDYRVEQVEFAIVHRDIQKLFYDFYVLVNLAEYTEKDTPRRKKIIRGLNDAMNLWNDGKGINEALAITEKLLASPANASAMDVYSIGHAHIDLAWLWPIRETRRKGGRTFATVLKLMEEYPEYKFGASQPQLYEWTKNDYPELYERIKKAIADKKWECQGAMWCEPDMNLSGGEALVRQCLYGKKFYNDEFGVEVKNLWLPDVFGYSAALPQILKKSDVNIFMTQKISWNETNKFPHHTFMWEGIDGTEILTHFLPTNDYNLANNPVQFIESEKRYAQSDVSDEYLNLYGIGDGGGGPSRMHLELGKRQQNLEGVSRFNFAFADDFFKKIDQIPKDRLPKWVGELYLELHRGTYTTQGLMKKNNRYLEQKLRKIEFLNVIQDLDIKNEMDQIWKDTLLNQFHDILPGSSINWVYKDANKLSKENLEKLDILEHNLVSEKFGKNEAESYFLYNANSWDRRELISLEKELGVYEIILANDEKLEVETENGSIEFEVVVPSCGYLVFNVKKTEKMPHIHTANHINNVDILENELIRVTFDYDGSIESIFDKECNRETLEGGANILQLWEDEPNNWGAWDINHFYRQTAPEKAKLHEKRFEVATEMRKVRYQKLYIGNSVIEQEIEIKNDSKQILFKTKVDWKEEHKMLRVNAKPAIHSDKATFEIQYGALTRSTHKNTSWDMAKFEVCAHRFADLSQPDYGFALINDCKYGHYVQGNELDLTLLRSPKDTDKEADLHEHEFTFGYYPHTDTLINSDTLQVAHDLNSKMEIFEINACEPKSESLFKLVGKNVKIETIKKSEDGKGIVLRMYEVHGSDADIDLVSCFNKSFIEEVNLLERPMNNFVRKIGEVENKAVYRLNFKPFEIRTFYLG